MPDLATRLRQNIKGEVRFDAMSRVLYSTDASIFEIEPLGVVLPRTADDVVAAISICGEEGVSLIARGGGTAQTGSALGQGVILDCSKYLKGVEEISLERMRARVQPGVVPDELNAELLGRGVMFPVDVSPANRANIGGMCGTNAGGSRSILYGKMIDNVDSLEVVLSDGQRVSARALSRDELEQKLARPGLEGEAYRCVAGLAEAHRSEIERRYPRIQRRVGGYNLDEFVKVQPFNLSKMLIGSEGTLAVTLEAEIKLVPRPKLTAVEVVHFRSVLEALEAAPPILELGPSQLELVDKFILDMTRQQLEYARWMSFVQGDPGALLFVEFYGETDKELTDKLERLEARAARERLGYAVTRAREPELQKQILSVRKAGLGLLLGMKGDRKPLAFVEDSAVPPERLAEYIRRFDEIVRAHDTVAAYYAHASVGLLHIRPLIDLKKATDVQKMHSIARAVTDLVLEFGGAVSGEHGDGLLRSEFNAQVFGPELYRAFRELKRGFDPRGILNCGKITDAQTMVENLRFGTRYRARQVRTHFSFAREGGFDRAIEMCNGNGACRKRVAGTMCPSYMVTLEEKHSTRGRANALRAAINGHLPAEALTSREMYDVLDLCLECKGCKAECPSNVDMAKLKYEFLAQYHARHGTPLRARLIGNTARMNRVGSLFAPFSTWVAQSLPFRWGLERAAGLDARRRLPPFARTTFGGWFQKRATKPQERDGDPVEGQKRVALLNDTFTNYNHPEIGRAAVELLEALGYQVELAKTKCCGRPMVSKGLLEEARAHARWNVAALAKYAEKGIPVIGLEPSCLLTLRDEYPDLVDDPRAGGVAANALMVEEFLVREMEEGRWKARFRPPTAPILFHGHCHQKALVGSAPSLRVLRALPEARITEVDSGCCGMAGSFGFEKEHYDISLAMGRRRLAPAIEAAPEAEVVAAGTSCRQQIAQLTGRKAKHLVEVLAECLLD